MSGAAQAFTIAFQVIGSDKTEAELEKIDKDSREAADGLEKTDKAARKADKSADGLTKTLGRSGRGIIAFRRALMHSMPVLGLLAVKMAAMKIAMNSLNFAKQAEDLLFLSNSAGIATDRLQRMGAVSKRNGGGGAGAVASSISALSGRIYNSQFGDMDPGLEKLALYGIEVMDNKGLLGAEQIWKNALEFIFDRNNSAAARKDIKDLVGMDDGTFNAAMRGRDYYNAEMAAGARTMLDAEDMRKLEQLQRVFRDFAANAENMSRRLAVDNAEGVKSVLESLNQLMDTMGSNAEALKAVTQGIITLCEWLIKAGSGIVKFAQKIGGGVGELVASAEKGMKYSRPAFDALPAPDMAPYGLDYSRIPGKAVSGVPAVVKTEITAKGTVDITSNGNIIGTAPLVFKAISTAPGQFETQSLAQ